MRVTSKQTGEERLEKYKEVLKLPEVFKGPKNCFNCRHFKIKLPIVRVDMARNLNGNPKIALLINYYPSDRKIKGGAKNPVARCSLGNLLKEDAVVKNGNIKEAEYNFGQYRWDLVRAGKFDPDWKFANRCDDYDSMLDEEPIDKGGGGITSKIF